MVYYIKIVIYRIIALHLIIHTVHIRNMKHYICLKNIETNIIKYKDYLHFMVTAQLKIFVTKLNSLITRHAYEQLELLQTLTYL